MSLFIIEGIDGSGKSTQIELLYNRLSQDGFKAKKLKFPMYEEESSGPVKMYLRGEFGQNPESVNAFAASSFYAVDRYSSFKKYWEQDVLDGTVLVSDRYTFSNVLHQSVKLPPSERVEFENWLFDLEYSKLGLPVPDKVFFLDVNPKTTSLNLSIRYAGDESKKDIHEKDILYLQKCYEVGIESCKRHGFTLVKCCSGNEMLPPDVINESIYADIISFIKK